MANINSQRRFVTDPVLIKTAMHILSYATEVAKKTDLISSDLLLASVWCCLNSTTEENKESHLRENPNNVESKQEVSGIPELGSKNQDVKSTLHSVGGTKSLFKKENVDSNTKACNRDMNDELKPASINTVVDVDSASPSDKMGKMSTVGKDGKSHECVSDHRSLSEKNKAQSDSKVYSVEMESSIRSDLSKSLKNTEDSVTVVEPELDRDNSHGCKGIDLKSIPDDSKSDVNSASGLSDKTKVLALDADGISVTEKTKFKQKCQKGIEKDDKNKASDDQGDILISDDDIDDTDKCTDVLMEESKLQNNNVLRTVTIERETKEADTEPEHVDYFDMDCEEIDEENEYEELADVSESINSKVVSNEKHPSSASVTTTVKASDKKVSEVTDVITIISDDEDDPLQDSCKENKVQSTSKKNDVQTPSKKSERQSPNKKNGRQTEPNLSGKGDKRQKALVKRDSEDKAKSKKDIKQKVTKTKLDSEVIDLDSDEETANLDNLPTKPSQDAEPVTSVKQMPKSSSERESLDPVNQNSVNRSESNLNFPLDKYAPGFSCPIMEELDSMSNPVQTNISDIAVKQEAAGEKSPEDDIHDISVEDNTHGVPVTLLGLIPRTQLQQAQNRRPAVETTQESGSSAISTQGLYVSSAMPYMNSSPGSSQYVTNVQCISNSIMASYAQGTTNIPGQLSITADGVYHSTGPHMTGYQQGCMYDMSIASGSQQAPMYLTDTGMGMDQQQLSAYSLDPNQSYTMSPQSMSHNDGSPPFKKRLLDFDKKWHMAPKFHQSPDRYLALPGGMEGNTVYSIEDRQRKMSAARQLMTNTGWQDNHIYTDIHNYPPNPSVGIETVDGIMNVDDFYIHMGQHSNKQESNLVNNDEPGLSESEDNSDGPSSAGKPKKAGRGRGRVSQRRGPGRPPGSRGRSLRGSVGRLRGLQRAGRRGRGRGRGASLSSPDNRSRGRGSVGSAPGRSSSVNSPRGSKSLDHSASPVKTVAGRGRGQFASRGRRRIGFYSVRLAVGRGRGRGRGATTRGKGAIVSIRGAAARGRSHTGAIRGRMSSRRSRRAAGKTKADSSVRESKEVTEDITKKEESKTRRLSGRGPGRPRGRGRGKGSEGSKNIILID